MQISESESQHTGTWEGSFEILHTQLLPAHPLMCNLKSQKTVRSSQPLSNRTSAPNNKQCPKTRGSWRWLHASLLWARPRTSACNSAKRESRTVANCVPFERTPTARPWESSVEGGCHQYPTYAHSSLSRKTQTFYATDILIFPDWTSILLQGPESCWGISFVKDYFLKGQKLFRYCPTKEEGSGYPQMREFCHKRDDAEGS